MLKSRSEIRRRAPEELLALKDKSTTASGEAGKSLINEARDFGLSLTDFLEIAIDPSKSDTPAKFSDKNGLVDGWRAAKIALDLPVRDDPQSAKFLELSADTFATFPGARALFPYVVDEVIQWKYRQTHFERVEDFVAQSRTIAAPELLTTIIDDAAADYKAASPVAEASRVRIKNLKATEQSTKFWKHGFGYEMSYEFQRRVRLDMIAPYAARSMKEVEMSKVGVATSTLINGDGVAAAATETDQSAYDGATGVTATDGTLSWLHLLHWLVARAQAGYPVDTLVGNWNAYLQILKMFAVPSTDKITSDVEMLGKSGFNLGGIPIVGGNLRFALSTTMTANKLIGLSKAEAIEELKEAGSLLDESERSIVNQTVRYVHTENTGYRIIFPDARAVFDYGN